MKYACTDEKKKQCEGTRSLTAMTTRSRRKPIHFGNVKLQINEVHSATKLPTDIRNTI